MDRIPEEPAREDRIAMEATVDCYNQEEAAMGWYYYLEDRLAFPFAAICTEERSVSLLRVDEEVEVLGMADEDDCLCEMFAEVAWQDRTFAVPLDQLDALDGGAATDRALGDWHYWVRRGYQLC
ncbi:MAG: calcium-binding protein [Bacteroidota bacterium]